MTDPANPSPLPAQLAAGVRQLLLLLGGIAVGKGWIGEENAETIIGAAMILLTFAYGQWRTREAAKAKSGSTPSSPQGKDVP